MECAFSNIALDNGKAIYTPVKTSWADSVSEMLDTTQVLQDMLIKPVHIVRIGKQVNDTYLPNLNTNTEGDERNFAINWKLMFLLFVIGEKEFYHACKECVIQSAPTQEPSAYTITGQ